jgi:pimeloyl-ACP methyl ester carboxylesterase
MDDVCRDLAVHDLAAWNIEYRRLGEPGGGWPGTFEDVAAAIDHVPALGLGGLPMLAIGHSAGGHLALWAAARPRPALAGAVAQAGVVDLWAAERLRLSASVVGELLRGAPAEPPARYAAASPRELLPLGVPQLLVHGARDDIVPVSMSRAYAEAAREAGDDVSLEVLDEDGHFEHLDPTTRAWALTRDWLVAHA